jgi:hypothetical protein
MAHAFYSGVDWHTRKKMCQCILAVGDEKTRPRKPGGPSVLSHDPTGGKSCLSFMATVMTL